MPTRTHTAEQAGAIVFDVALTAGTIRVTVEDRSAAEVTISTEQDRGPAAEMVRSATITERPGRLTIRVPDPAPVTVTGVQAAGGHRGVTSAGRSNIVFNGTVTAGAIAFGSGAVAIGGASVVVGAPVTVEVRLPLGSSLTARTVAAEVETAGELAAADVTTIAGSILVAAVIRPRLESTSGEVRIDRLTGDGSLKTISGHTRVHAAVECSLRASSISGDIRVSGARVDLDASSVSGRITTR
jgi:hypothetical protein